MAHSKMLSDLLHVFKVKECIKTGFVYNNNKKEMRLLLKFCCDPPSKLHGTHLDEPNSPAESAGQWMLGDPCCCVPLTAMQQQVLAK